MFTAGINNLDIFGIDMALAVDSLLLVSIPPYGSHQMASRLAVTRKWMYRISVAPKNPIPDNHDFVCNALPALQL